MLIIPFIRLRIQNSYFVFYFTNIKQGNFLLHTFICMQIWDGSVSAHQRTTRYQSISLMSSLGQMGNVTHFQVGFVHASFLSP